MLTVMEIINDANYLLDSQKKRLLGDLKDKTDMTIVDLKDMIFDFVEMVIGMSKADLSTEDMNKIDAWLEREEK